MKTADSRLYCDIEDTNSFMDGRMASEISSHTVGCSTVWSWERTRKNNYLCIKTFTFRRSDHVVRFGLNIRKCICLFSCPTHTIPQSYFICHHHDFCLILAIYWILQLFTHLQRTKTHTEWNPGFYRISCTINSTTTSWRRRKTTAPQSEPLYIMRVWLVSDLYETGPSH